MPLNCADGRRKSASSGDVSSDQSLNEGGGPPSVYHVTDSGSGMNSESIRQVLSFLSKRSSTSTFDSIIVSLVFFPSVLICSMIFGNCDTVVEIVCICPLTNSNPLLTSLSESESESIFAEILACISSVPS